LDVSTLVAVAEFIVNELCRDGGLVERREVAREESGTESASLITGTKMMSSSSSTQSYMGGGDCCKVDRRSDATVSVGEPARAAQGSTSAKGDAGEQARQDEVIRVRNVENRMTISSREKGGEANSRFRKPPN
jgi:hypothetical protein